jgi:hypothetical protein
VQALQGHSRQIQQHKTQIITLLVDAAPLLLAALALHSICGISHPFAQEYAQMMRQQQSRPAIIVCGSQLCLKSCLAQPSWYPGYHNVAYHAANKTSCTAKNILASAFLSRANPRKRIGASITRNTKQAASKQQQGKHAAQTIPVLTCLPHKAYRRIRHTKHKAWLQANSNLHKANMLLKPFQSSPASPIKRMEASVIEYTIAFRSTRATFELRRSAASSLPLGFLTVNPASVTRYLYPMRLD